MQTFICFSDGIGDWRATSDLLAYIPLFFWSEMLKKVKNVFLFYLRSSASILWNCLTQCLSFFHGGAEVRRESRPLAPGIINTAARLPRAPLGQETPHVRTCAGCHDNEDHLSGWKLLLFGLRGGINTNTWKSGERSEVKVARFLSRQTRSPPPPRLLLELQALQELWTWLMTCLCRLLNRLFIILGKPKCKFRGDCSLTSLQSDLAKGSR